MKNLNEKYKMDNLDDIKRFITGGKAILTLESKSTGRWFTFRVKKAKKDDEKSPFFVSVLVGPDNENSYSYVGTIFNNDGKLSFHLTKKSTIGEDAMSYKAFRVFFDLLMVNKLNINMNVYHRGVCGRCGRTLTVPESLITGLGPECRGLVEKHVSEIRKTKLQKLNRKLMAC